MKKLIFIILIFTIPLKLIAQDSLKQKEIGISFKNLKSFGLTYKFGTNKNLWRLNTVYISGSSIGDLVNSNTFGIRFGNEFRNKIDSKLELCYGLDIQLKFSKSTNSSNNRFFYTTGFNLVLGFNYLLNNNISIGAELLPEFFYYRHDNENHFVYRINNDVMLSLSYRFK